MTQTNRFGKLIFTGALIIFLMGGGIIFFIWFQLSQDQKFVLIAMGQENILSLLGLAFLIFSALGAFIDIIYNTYIRPMKRMSAEAHVMYTSNPSHRIKIKGSKDITNLSQVINNFAEMFENLNKIITKQILSAKKETEKERNLLAAIMAELPQGIIICNKNGRVLLFNSLAKKIFTHKTKHFIGLGRSIFHLLDKSLIAHAIDEIQERLNNQKKSVGSFFITPIYTQNLIGVEVIPILDPNNIMTGFILIIQDISQDIQKYETINTQLSEFQAALEKVTSTPNLHRIKTKYHQVCSIILDLSLSKLPLTTLNLRNFLQTLQKKTAHEYDIRIDIFNDHWNTQILADAYSLTRAFIFLFKNLARLTCLTQFNLFISHPPNAIDFAISWEKAPCLVADIENIMHQRINALPGFGYVLKFNNALINFFSPDKTTCSSINIITKAGEKSLNPIKSRAPILTGSRPEFYDFDLFNVDNQSKNLLDINLKEITFTVFDTETTGLNPDEGDEIISIGAVRIVNNKISYQDIFEELIDPKRDIPIESYRIHGINAEMVVGKEPIEKVLPRFKQFTANTVLLGHNLSFDMKMLKIKEKTTGIRFNNPTLDTLLLSAMLHPVHKQHDMESIAKRLGINIIGRHTALGDAITTAQIFKKLLPILNSNGILTLKDALDASQKTYYARLKY
ncbi:MAG: PAS domain-containing protein [Desulfobacteraceae bacterium]|nr:PAS domain-containing protein [Desulfobacteraceae bacterium]